MGADVTPGVPTVWLFETARLRVRRIEPGVLLKAGMQRGEVRHHLGGSRTQLLIRGAG